MAIDFIFIAQGFPITDVSYFPLIMLIYFGIELITMPLANAYSRAREIAADLFALDVVKKPIAQISTEKRLADVNLGDTKPHPFVEFFLYTHPNTMKRIKLAEDWNKLFKKKFDQKMRRKKVAPKRKV